MTTHDNLALFQQICNDPEQLIKLQEFVKKQSKEKYEYFLMQLRVDLQDIILKLENSRDKHFDSDEDKITNYICSMLQMKGYNATEQTKQNGAVDLTIIRDDFKWIAEAKIGVTNSKILEGLLQILTRYVTRDKYCGLFVYVKKSGVKKVINSWSSYLKNKEEWSKYIQKKCISSIEDIEIILNNVEIINSRDAYFQSKHTLVSGDAIEVDNFFVNLYHNPTDTSGDKSNSHRINIAKHGLAHIYYELEDGLPLDISKLTQLLSVFFKDYDPDDN